MMMSSCKIIIIVFRAIRQHT